MSNEMATDAKKMVSDAVDTDYDPPEQAPQIAQAAPETAAPAMRPEMMDVSEPGGIEQGLADADTGATSMPAAKAPEPSHGMDAMKSALEHKSPEIKPMAVPDSHMVVPPAPDIQGPQEIAAGVEKMNDAIAVEQGVSAAKKKKGEPVPVTPAAPEPPASHHEGGGIGSFVNDVGKALGLAYLPAQMEGLALGAGHTFDSVQAMIPGGPDDPLISAVSKATGLKTHPFESAEQDIENALTHGDQKAKEELEHNPDVQVSKFVSEAAPYLMSPIGEVGKAAEAFFTPGMGAKAAKALGQVMHVAAGLGEGAAINAVQSIADQKANGGKVDPNKVLNDALLGASMAGAGMLAGKGLRKLFGPGSEEARVEFIKQMRANQKAAQDLARAVEDAAHEAEIASQKLLKAAVGPNAPTTSRQSSQLEMMNAVEFSLRALAHLDSVWDASTPAEIGAIQTLVDAGYHGVEAIEEALREHGLGIEPLLIEMNKVITPPSRRERFQALEQDMRDLAAKEGEAKTEQALEGEFPRKEPEQPPLVEAELVPEEGDFKFTPQGPTPGLLPLRIERFHEANPLRLEADEARFQGTDAYKDLADQARMDGKWPASVGSSGYIPLGGKLPQATEPTAEQIQRVQMTLGAEKPEWKSMSDGQRMKATDAIEHAKDIGPATEAEVKAKIDDDFGPGVAEAIEPPKPALEGHIEENVAEEPAGESAAEVPEEVSPTPATEKNSSFVFFGNKGSTKVEFDSALDERVFTHGKHLQLMMKHKDYKYTNSTKVNKMLADELGVKPDEMSTLSREYADKIDEAAEAAATPKDQGTAKYAAPAVARPEKPVDSSMSLINKFNDLLEKSDNATGEEKAALEGELDDLQEQMEARTGKAKPVAPRISAPPELKAEAPKFDESPIVDEKATPAEKAIKALKPDVTATELKATINAVKDAGVDQPESPGIFRRPYRGHEYGGYGRAQHGIPFENTKGFIADDLHNEGTVALQEIGEAKMARMIAEDNYFHSAENAFNLAATEEQQALIKSKVEKELVSEKKQEREALMADLKLEQDEEQKRILEEQIAQTQEIIDNSKNKNERKKLHAQITQMHEDLQKYSDPARGLTDDQGLYTVADPVNVERHNAKSRKLATTFEAALEQAQADKKVLMAAEKRFDEAYEKHKPLFGKLADSYRAAVKNARPNAEFESPAWSQTLKHPQDPSVTATAVTQMQFKPSAATKLHGKYLLEMRKWDRMADNLTDAWRSSTVYSVAMKAFRMSPAEAHKLLIDKGLIDPKARRLAAIAAFGLTGMTTMQAAQASGLADMDPDERHAMTDNAAMAMITGGVVVAAIAAALGVPAAKKLVRLPAYYWRSLNRTVSQSAHLADAAMEVTEHGESLGHALDELRGALSFAHTRAPDDYPEYIAAVAGGKFSGNGKGKFANANLTNDGKKAVEYALRAEADFKKFANDYIDDRWVPFYEGLSDAEKAKLQDVDEVVHFIQSAYTKPGPSKKRSGFDVAYSTLYKNISHGLLLGTAKSAMGAWVAETATVGTLGVGSDVGARVLLEMGGNPVLGAFLRKSGIGKTGEVLESLDSVSVPGQFSRKLYELGADKALEKPMLAEVHRAKYLYACAAFKYFHNNKAEMDAIKQTNWVDFLRWSTEAMPEGMEMDVMMDFHTKAANLLAEAAKADFTGLEKDFIERSDKLGGFMWWTSNQLREARMFNKTVQLAITNGSKGDMGASLKHTVDALAFVASRWQLGGALAIPASVSYILSNGPATQQFILNAQAFLNKTSVIHQNFGAFPGVGWDPLFAPMTGISNEIGGTYAGLTEDLAGTARSLHRVVDMISEDRFSEIFTGSSTDKDIKQARAAILKSFSFIMKAAPWFVSVPAHYTYNFGNALPHYLNQEYETGVSRFTLGGNAGPLPLKPKDTYPADEEADNPFDATQILGDLLHLTPEEETNLRVGRDAIDEGFGFKSPTASRIEEQERARLLMGNVEFDAGAKDPYSLEGTGAR